MPKKVVIVGGGPNGLMLACELALGGIRPVVLERLTEPTTEPKSNGLVGQVVRMVDRRGLFERFTGTPGTPEPNRGYFMFAAMPLSLGVLDDNPMYNLPIPEARMVRLLTERATELGVEIRRGHEFVGLAQDDGEVTVTVDGPDGRYDLRTHYLVGADGAHSATRKAAGIGFPGVTYDRTTGRTAHATVPPEWLDPQTHGLNIPGYGPVLPFLPIRTDAGGFSYAPLPGVPPLVSTMEWDQPAIDVPMTLAELEESIERVLGVAVPLTPPSGDGPFVLRRLHGDSTRMAEKYRHRRVFLVGDAAHVFAAGGTGLNLGMQDAINLGWKLAAVLNGHADVLDTYEAERRPCADRTVVYAQVQSALLAPGKDVTALRSLFGELLTHRDAVGVIAGLIAGADVRLPVDAHAHPLVGWLAPELDLHTEGGVVRLSELARNARPTLIDLTADGLSADVDVVRAKADTAATAILLRPDSYVVWASDDPHPDQDELSAAVRTWFTA